MHTPASNSILHNQHTTALLAEFLGTALLLATVIGSGIMGERLSAGNEAIALLANSIATGTMLYVLIAIFGPLSGAHFNPAVTLAFWMEKTIDSLTACYYLLVQLLGAICGVLLANLMFATPVITWSSKLRSSPALWLSEWVATLGLVMVILLGVKKAPKAVPALVGCYITSAYWFTGSTSFANPAVTIARVFSDSFAGIHIDSIPWFIGMQIIGALTAVLLYRLLTSGNQLSQQ